MPTYSDGNFQAPFLVANVVSYPFPWPGNSNIAQFDLEFVVAANNYTEAVYGSNTALAPNAYLVEKGQIVKVAPGFVRYKRTYCQLPIDWSESQQVAYTFPGRSGPVAANNNTFNPYFFGPPVTLMRDGNVFHNYSQGDASPSLDATFKVTDGNNLVDYVGIGNPAIGAGFTDPSIMPSSFVVSSDAKLIKGLIWEKVTITVPL